MDVYAVRLLLQTNIYEIIYYFESIENMVRMLFLLLSEQIDK